MHASGDESVIDTADDNMDGSGDDSMNGSVAYGVGSVDYTGSSDDMELSDDESSDSDRESSGSDRDSDDDSDDDIEDEENGNEDGSDSGKDDELAAKQKKKWIKRHILTKREDDFEEFVKQEKKNFVSFLTLLRETMLKNLDFDPNLRLFGQVFDWEEHLQHVDDILKLKDANLIKAAKVSYINDWRRDEFEDALKVWNDSYQSREEMIFDVGLTCKEFALLKSRLFYLQERGMIKETFDANKKKFKQHYSVEISLHNEVGRLLVEDSGLYKDLPHLLGFWTHVEAMGCAEGRCEGK